MPDHEFLFSLCLCEGGRNDDMLRELTTRVLGFAGCPAGAAGEIGDQLLAGLADGATAGARHEVQFRAHAGEIEIILSAGGRPVYRASRRLP